MTAKTAPKPRKKSASGGFGQKLSAVLATPQLNYKVIVSVTLILTTLGVTMVLSSSMVTSRTDESSVWTVFLKQVAFALLGLATAWGTLRLRSDTIKRFSPYFVIVALVLQFALFIPGVGVGQEIGSHSWIRVNGVGIQPSELAKVALAVWGSAVVTRRVRQDPHLIRGLGTFLMLAGTMMIVVLIQMDLGMMLTVGIVFLSLVFFAGLSNRIMAFFFGGVLFLAGVATVTQAYRNDRMRTWMDALTLNFREGTTQGPSYQTYQGLLSLSDGSLTGTGLGQSRAKWYYLPEAKNDFIFAIIGEELGWIGAVIVVVLFCMLGWFGLRTALAQTDPFLAMMAVTLTLGIVVQAFYNMSYVLGLVPMTGIQLPLISAGGTSMVITLGFMGLLANCARHEPEAISSMQHEGRNLFDRVLGLPEPLPYRSGEQRRIRRRESTRRYGDPVTRRPSTPGSAGHDVSADRRRRRQARERIPRRNRLADYDGSSTWHRRESLPPKNNRRR